MANAVNPETKKPRISLPLATAAAILNLGSPATLDQIVDFIKEWLPYYKQQSAWYGTKFETNVFTYRNIDMKTIGNVQKFSVKNERQYRKEVENFVRRHRITEFGLCNPDKWKTFFGYTLNIHKRTPATEDETGSSVTAQSVNAGYSTSHTTIAAASSSRIQEDHNDQQNSASLSPANDIASALGESAQSTPSRPRGRPRLYKFPQNRSSGRPRGRPRKDEQTPRKDDSIPNDDNQMTTPARDLEENSDEEVILIDDDGGVPNLVYSSHNLQSNNDANEKRLATEPSSHRGHAIVHNQSQEQAGPSTSNRTSQVVHDIIEIDTTPPNSSFTAPLYRPECADRISLVQKQFAAFHKRLPSIVSNLLAAERAKLLFQRKSPNEDDVIVIDDDDPIGSHPQDQQQTVAYEAASVSAAGGEEEEYDDDVIIIEYSENTNPGVARNLSPRHIMIDHTTFCEEEEIIILSSGSPSPAHSVMVREVEENNEPVDNERSSSHPLSTLQGPSGQPELISEEHIAERGVRNDVREPREERRRFSEVAELNRQMNTRKNSVRQTDQSTSNGSSIDDRAEERNQEQRKSLLETVRVTGAAAKGQKRDLRCSTSSANEERQPPRKMRQLLDQGESSTKNQNVEIEDHTVVTKRVTRASFRMSLESLAASEHEQEYNGEQNGDEEEHDDDPHDSVASDSEPENDNEEEVTATIHNCRLPIHVYVGLAILNGKRSSARIPVVMKFLKHFKHFKKCSKTFTQDLREALQYNEFIKVAQKKDKGEWFFSIKPENMAEFKKELSQFDNLSSGQIGLKKKEMWEQAKRGRLGICKPKPKKEEKFKIFMTSVDCESQRMMYEQYLNYAVDLKERMRETADQYELCVFCHKHRCSAICDEYPYYEDRVKRCREMKKCNRCFLPRRPGHKEDCVVHWCDYCNNSKHSYAMCTENKRPVKAE